jgi:hypothetical protein
MKAVHLELADRRSKEIIEKGLRLWRTKKKHSKPMLLRVWVAGEKKTLLVMHHNITVDCETEEVFSDGCARTEKSDYLLTCFPNYVEDKPEGLLFPEHRWTVSHTLHRRKNKWYIKIYPDRGRLLINERGVHACTNGHFPWNEKRDR